MEYFFSKYFLVRLLLSNFSYTFSVNFIFITFVFISIIFILIKTNAIDKIVLKKEIPKESNNSTELERLLGEIGRTKTILKPYGIVTINQKDYDSISNINLIQENTVVEVIKINKGKIVVKYKEEY